MRTIVATTALTMLYIVGAQDAFAKDKPLPPDDRDCAKNFTFEGSFSAGRVFKTSAVILGVTNDEALKRAARNLASVGWSIDMTNIAMGMISASQNVKGGGTKTVPLTFMSEAVDGGVRVEMVYKTTAGVTSPVEAVRNQFCVTFDAVAKKQ